MNKAFSASRNHYFEQKAQHFIPQALCLKKKKKPHQKQYTCIL